MVVSFLPLFHVSKKCCVPSTAWEKHYNVRQGSSVATTLIFSSAEALHMESSVAESSHNKLNVTPSPPPSLPTVESNVKSTYISEMTIETSADARPTTPQHTYRSLMNAKADRFNYLRQVSEGRPYPSSYSSSSTGNSKLSDPGPPKSLMDLNLSRAAASGVQHQRSHSDSDSPSSASASIQPPKPPVPPKVAPPPRPKRPEELECDQLSKDLMIHLLPSDSRLHALLSVPDPSQAAACLRTEGLLEVTPPPASSSPFFLQVTTAAAIPAYPSSPATSSTSPK